MIREVIVTKNEEKNIEACLKSLYFCDELIVIDDNSTDKTAKIAEKYGAKVFIREIKKDMSAQLNFGMDKAGGDWILFIDADERITKKLASEIKECVKNADMDIAGFSFRRIDFIWGKWLTHGEIASFRSTRLVKKGRGKWIRRVHQNFYSDGVVKTLVNPILHYPHQSLREFIISVDRWSDWHSLANNEEGKSSNIFKITSFPILHFIKNYLFRLGHLDGMQGFVFATMMSFHSYLAWSKLWILQKNITKK